MFSKPINRWWTVVAGAIGTGTGVGVVAGYVFGVFITSISAEFGWERSYTTAGISALYIASGIGSLVLGSVMTKWSIRAVTMLFVAMFSLSVMAVGLMPGSVVLFCIIFASIGFFGAAATAMPYAIAIARQFDRNRGIALALAVSGSGAGVLLLPSFANYLMQGFGWRAAYVGIGAIVGGVPLAALILCFRSPPIPAGHASGDAIVSLRALATSSKTFWLVALAILAISIALVGVITNFFPILTDRGIDPAQAARIVGLLGAASWVSRLGVGALLDRMHARVVAMAIFLLSGLGIVVTAVSGDGALIYVAAILLGLGIGAEADLITFVMSRYFPAKSLPKVLGAVWVFFAWGNGLGVFIASLSFDLTGSYNMAYAIFTGLALFSALTISRLGTYVFPADEASGHRSAIVTQPQQHAPTRSESDHSGSYPAAVK